jgi:YHS domain-containing protein
MGLLAFVFRAILFLFVFRLAGIVLRAFLGGFFQGSRPEGPSSAPRSAGWGSGPEPRGPVEELVKDPVCGVHTARSSAIVGRYRGSTAYFCSEECAARAGAGPA